MRGWHRTEDVAAQGVTAFGAGAAAAAAAATLTSLAQHDVGPPSRSRKAEESRGLDGSKVLARVMRVEADVKVCAHPVASNARLLLALFGQAP